VRGEKRDERGNEMAHHATIRATPSALHATAFLLLLFAALAATAEPAAAAATDCLALPLARCLSVGVPLDRSSRCPGRSASTPRGFAHGDPAARRSSP
jgi:hypothetical protein